MLLQKKWLPLFILISFTSILFFFKITSFEPDLNDEGLYLLNSILGFSAVWSPLYSAYYWLAGQFIGDGISKFYATFYLTSAILLPTATYLLSYRFFKSWTVSILLSLIIFLSENNLGPITRLHVFNFSILTLLYLIFYSDRSVLKSTIFFCLLGLSIHLRIENFFLAIGLLFMLFIDLSRGDTKKRYIFLYLFFFFGAFALPTWNGFHPVFSGTERSMLAFVDHYIWAHSALTPDWAAFEKLYPKADSVLSFLMSYPYAFVVHIWSNLLHIPLELSKTVVPYYSHINPSRIFLLLLAIGYALPESRESVKATFRDWTFLFALLLPTLTLNIGMHPWGRYMVPLTFATMIFTVWFGQMLRLKIPFHWQWTRNKFFAPTIVIVFVLASFLTQKNLPETAFSQISKEWKNINVRNDERIIFSNFLPLFVSSKNTPLVYLAVAVFAKFGNWKLHEQASLFCHTDLYDMPRYSGLTDTYHDFIAKSEDYGFKPYYEGKLLWCARKETIPQ